MGNDLSRKSYDEPMAKPTRTLVDHTADVVTAFRGDLWNVTEADTSIEAVAKILQTR